jgi:hypothetical protein
MAANTTNLSLYRYNQVVNFNAGGYSAATTASAVRTYFLGTTKISLGTVPISLFFLEQLGRIFVEKQVTRLDDNFLWYNAGMKLQNWVPGTPPPGLHFMVAKSYSGDVSGDIGESLFVYSIVASLGIPLATIGHLRPAKAGGQLTPDFLILGNSPNFSSLFTGTPIPPFYAEVKSCTGTMDQARISHALDQLTTVMPAHSYGTLFLVHKGNSLTYVGLFVPVRK